VLTTCSCMLDLAYYLWLGDKPLLSWSSQNAGPPFRTVARTAGSAAPKQGKSSPLSEG
jgi:hypothetical protein